MLPDGRRLFAGSSGMSIGDRLLFGIGLWVVFVTMRVYFAGITMARSHLGSANPGAFLMAWAPLAATLALDVFIVLDRRDGTFDLLAPAPQAAFDAPSPERVFERLLDRADAAAVEGRLAQEVRFDADLWVVEIEDRQGRPFVELLGRPGPPPGGTEQL